MLFSVGQACQNGKCACTPWFLGAVSCLSLRTSVPCCGLSFSNWRCWNVKQADQLWVPGYGRSWAPSMPAGPLEFLLQRGWCGAVQSGAAWATSACSLPLRGEGLQTTSSRCQNWMSPAVLCLAGTGETTHGCLHKVPKAKPCCAVADWLIL